MSTRKALGILILIVLIGYGIYNSLDSDARDSNNKGLSAFDSGNTQEAIDQLQQASQGAVTNDTKISTLKNLAYVYSTDGQNDKAIDTFKQALALTTQGSFDNHLISGEIYLLQGNPSSALSEYNKAYAIEPNNFQINNALALFYLNLDDSSAGYEDYAKALPFAQKAVQQTDLEIAKQNLGIAYYFNGKYNEAINTLSGISLDKNSYTAYYIGLSYARLDDPTNAKIYLNRAIANGVKVPQEVYDYLNTY